MGSTSPLAVLISVQCAELDNGVCQVLLALLPRMRERDISVHLVLPEEGPLERQLKAAGIQTLVEPVQVFTGPHPINIHHYADGLQLRAKRLADYIGRHGIDLVNTHTFIHWDAAVAARIAGVPHVWSEHNLFGLGAECCLFRKMTAVVAQRIELLDLMGDAYVSVSQSVSDTLIAAGSRRIQKVIYNRINLQHLEQQACQLAQYFELSSLLDLPDNAIIIGNVSRIDPVKDHRTFLAVAAQVCHRYPQVHFVVAGPVNNQLYYDELCQCMADRGLNNKVHFIGSVSNAASLYRQFDLYLLTSVCEGFSLSLMEAMASGCAIVATDSGGVTELIEDQISGFIADRKAVDALAGYVERLVQDRSLRERMGQAAQQRINRFNSWDGAAREYVELYRNLVDQSAEHSTTVSDAELVSLQAQLSQLVRVAALEADIYKLEASLSAYQWQGQKLEASVPYRLYRFSKRWMEFARRAKSH
ncbi:glycosyltransferase [Aestuariirhabdus sp. Z084]|uniref:glycosyltransferase family 4 protein n=1 Tax=Aestuariirhabdus haliotis TaxID=2918751 RepID=UPI00201B4506|nr:glycosyltransferase [Aestuariirhabdus haliotis]MCL6416391.1 glycosyltransferase [Aestuariirhabdus haliotis]MCL6420380.1 glycosyltransferase [Aestuariirhabdus haliotis]